MRSTILLVLSAVAAAKAWGTLKLPMHLSSRSGTPKANLLEGLLGGGTKGFAPRAFTHTESLQC